MGLLLMFPEYRAGTLNGKFKLSADDFVSEFNRRAFETIMELEREDNYAFSVLGEFFNTNEISRLGQMELKRRSLTENGVDVFEQSIEALKKEKELKNGESGDSLDAIQRILQAKREKLNK